MMGFGQSKPKTLPLASGQFSVGCADLMTEFSSDGVFMRLFYPIEPCDLAQRKLQFPQWLPRIEYLDGYADFIGWSHDRFRFIFNWKIGKVVVPCLWQAPLLSPSPRQFPVIVFSHGLGAMRTTYSTFCCDMASQGYVVAAIEHRDRSACFTYYLEEAKNADNEYLMLEEKPLRYQKLQPNEKEFKLRNRQLHKRVNECIRAMHLLEEINLGKCGANRSASQATRIVMDDAFDWSQFTGRLDLSRVSISGHSFGGATAIAACAVCSEFRAGLILDGWMFPLENDIYPKVAQPLCFVNTDYFQWKDNVRRMKRLDSDTQERTMVTIKDSVHQSQTDFTYLMKGWVARKLQTCGRIDPFLCNSINNRVSLAFLNFHLGFDDNYAIAGLISEYNGWLINGTNVDLEEKPNL